MTTQPTPSDSRRSAYAAARALLRKRIDQRTQAILDANGAPAVPDPYDLGQMRDLASESFGHLYATTCAAIDARARAEVAAEKEYAAATRALNEAIRLHNEAAERAANERESAAIQAATCPTCFTVPSASGVCLCGSPTERSTQ